MPDSQKSWAARLATESGIAAIRKSSYDTKILCAQRFVRMFAYGFTFLILVHFLSELGISDSSIGLFMTLTLLGDTVISFFLTAMTDRLGRRRVLAGGAVLMSLSGFVFATSETYWILVLASVVGVISPSGNEIGPFRAVEESVLAQLTDKSERSDVFAWYTLFGTAGAALGTVSCGWMVQLLEGVETWSSKGAYKTVFAVYALLGLVKLGLVVCLTRGVEAEALKTQYEELALSVDDGDLSDDDSAARPLKHTAPSHMDRLRGLFPSISLESRSILYRLLLLFFLDSFASGMASPSWLTYFFTTVHALPPSSLGTLFLITNILSTLSNLAALPLARRLGPLRTMVFTHLPSALFLATVPLPPATALGTWLAMALLALRSCTSSMDQAPRQAFLAAAVLPGERTAVLGIVNVFKTMAQAGGAGVAGVLAGRDLWVVMLSGAGALKAGYDLLMLWMFVGLRDREEPRGRGDEEGNG